jgi:hypothetical protein
MASRKKKVRIYTQRGRAPAAIRREDFFWGKNCFPAGEDWFPGEEYPQTGQPPLKSPSAPVNPQAGQRTEAKYRPQRGQLLVSRLTSAPQFSQKNRGDLAKPSAPYWPEAFFSVDAGGALPPAGALLPPPPEAVLSEAAALPGAGVLSAAAVFSGSGFAPDFAALALSVT